MIHFVRQSIKGCRHGNFNQYYKSSISDEVFSFISKELNVNDVNGNIYEIFWKVFWVYK